MSKRSQFFLLPIVEPRAPGAASVLSLLLIALYLPFVWIPLAQTPWESKRWFWMKASPALPGFCIQSLGILSEAPPEVGYSLMGAATLGLLVVGYRLGRQSRSGLLLAFLIVLGISCWNSWLAFEAFQHS